MKLPLLIAGRYFFSRKKDGDFTLVSIISAISLLGYVIGAMALIIVLSVFNGFEDVFKKMYNRFDPDIQITIASGKSFERNAQLIAQIAALDGVVQVAEVLEENVLVKYDNRQVIAKAKGVDQQYIGLTGIDSCLVAGEAIIHYENIGYYALVGQEIAWKLAVDPGNVFKRLILYVPSPGEVDVTNPESNFNKDIIAPAGIFSVQQEIDETYIIVPLQFLQELAEREGYISAIDLKLSPTTKSEQVKKQIYAIMGSEYLIKNRYEQREAFYKIMRSEKLISYVILLFILLIAAANSIASLYLLMLEKRNDIKLLAYIGMGAKDVYRIFQFEGLFISLVGSITGILLGIVLVWLQQEYGFIALGTEVSFIFNSYPVALKFSDVLLVLVTVVLLGLATARYPASKAAQLVK
jgi:lipoprotein-releasing system permease protein